MTSLFNGGGGGGGAVSIGFGGSSGLWNALYFLWPLSTLNLGMYGGPNYIVRYPMTSSGVIRNLYVCGYASSPSGFPGTFTVSVRKNGVLQSLGLTFNPQIAQVYLSNLTDSFTVAAGDYLEVTGISDANCNHQINVFMEFAP